MTTGLLSQMPSNDCEWQEFGGIPIGLGGQEVFDITTSLYGGLYFAGNIDMAGDLPVSNIVYWDGSGWDDMNGGVNGIIYDIEMDSSSNPIKLLVAGEFTKAGNTDANNVAYWDGSQWHSIGTGAENGVNGRAWAIDFDPQYPGSDFYVGGQFTEAGTTSANNIAKWDGNNWSTFGSGITGGFAPYVHSLEIIRIYAGNTVTTQIYAGGRFEQADGIDCNNIAWFDGTNWTPLGTGPTNGVNNIVAEIEIAYFNPNVGVYVAGLFNQAGGSIANRLAQWDGVSWSGIGWPLDGLVFDIEKRWDGSWIIGGDFSQIGGIAANNVVHYDSQNWSALGSDPENGTNGRVNAVYVDYPELDQIYAAGDFGAAGTVPASNVAYWKDSPTIGQTTGEWMQLNAGSGTGVNHEIREFAHDSQGNLYAVGDINNAGNATTSGIAIWDDMQWSALSDDVFDNEINDIVIDANDNIYVSGNFRYINGSSYNKIAMWNGASWNDLDLGTFSGQIHDLALDNNQNLYAVGSFTDIGGTAANRIAKWNGGSWEAIGSGLNEGLNGTAYAINFDTNDLMYVGGDFTAAGTISASRIATWDGTTWAALSSGLNGRVNAIEIDDTVVYVGGRFVQAGGQIVNQIANWDGANWNKMDLGIGSNLVNFPEVYSIDIDQNGFVYVVGNFLVVSQLLSHKIARWDGTNWWNIKGDCQNSDQAFEADATVLDCHLIDDDILYVGGSFTSVSSQTSRGIASYNANNFPVAKCKDTTVELDADGSYTLNPDEIDDGSFTPCGSNFGPQIPGQQVFTCDDLGLQIVELYVVDASCHISICESQVTVLDPHGYCCPVTMFVQASPIPNGFYQASQKVHSNNTVPLAADVTFQASSTICLDPGFEVNGNAEFEAIIDVCQ